MGKNSKALIDQIREEAENDLESFIKLVAPHRVLGSIHKELIRWWTGDSASSHMMTLLPRGHQKSAMVAYYAAWLITRQPEITILYISATANLAEKQLGAIGGILTSKVYRKYWPEMVHEEVGKRTKWSVNEIKVDHPKREEEGVRDPTVFTAGLTTVVTGLHCDVAILDDVVVAENAYTEEGRRKVQAQYSLLASIENSDAKEIVVGTRYHPRDLYSSLMSLEYSEFNDDGEEVSRNKLYKVFERVVEDSGNGTGEFLWPRQQRSDGKWFGFDTKTLMVKKSQYIDKTQFFAQYYNDPNDRGNSPISSSTFQYYDRKYITQKGGTWFFRDRPLRVYAAMDFAYSLGKRSDYTAIVIVGIDRERNKYVLDIDRIKTDKMSDYADLAIKKFLKWDYKKLRAEITAGQKAIVREVKERIRNAGLVIRVDEYSPSRHEGTKEERISASLAPAYDNGEVWHYRGGNCQVLEDELILMNPAHDDVKDALASCFNIAVPPKTIRARATEVGTKYFNSRFGGIGV